jgi:hypothetical protein
VPRRAGGLTAAKVRTAKPGRYGDGGGLYLLVRDSDAKFWVFRYNMPGSKLREMGLGKADASGRNGVSLAAARDQAAELHRMVRAGIDPLQYRTEQEAAARARAADAQKRAKTFADAAADYLRAHAGAWHNAKHRAQWVMTLRDYAGPFLDALPVADIDTEHVKAALEPLWRDKPETASRLRGRIEAVLDFATVNKWRDGANPARWRGHLDKVFPKRAKLLPVKHHPALPWTDMSAFMSLLRQRDSIAARALEFGILTAARSGEVLGARWSEVDLKAAIWTIPSQRMKAGKEHRVPLAPPAVALLSETGSFPHVEEWADFSWPRRRPRAL